MGHKPAPFHIVEGDYYTLTQVAELHQVYPQTVLYWVTHSWLPAIRLSGLGYIVAEQDALAYKPRRKARASKADKKARP